MSDDRRFLATTERHERQRILRARIRKLLSRPMRADSAMSTLRDEGWTVDQIIRARSAVAINYVNRGGIRMWRRKSLPQAQAKAIDAPPAQPVVVVRKPVAVTKSTERRELSKCDDCGRYIGLRRAGERPLCLLCQERAA